MDKDENQRELEKRQTAFIAQLQNAIGHWQNQLLKKLGNCINSLDSSTGIFFGILRLFKKLYELMMSTAKFRRYGLIFFKCYFINALILLNPCYTRWGGGYSERDGGRRIMELLQRCAYIQTNTLRSLALDLCRC